MKTGMSGDLMLSWRQWTNASHAARYPESSHLKIVILNNSKYMILCDTCSMCVVMMSFKIQQKHQTNRLKCCSIQHRMVTMISLWTSLWDTIENCNPSNLRWLTILLQKLMHAIVVTYDDRLLREFSLGFVLVVLIANVWD